MTTAHVSPAEAAVIRKIAWRVVPILSAGYLIAYLDRSNIGIAALTMMQSLGLNAAQFGVAAGLFFVGYFLGELPSNLLQVRFGARRWIARIMITWGLVSAAMAIVSTPTGLYFLRVLLGIAEAGFTPGAIMYLAFFFPAAYRTRIFAYFLLAIPVSVVVGAPISAGLLYLDGVAGLHGWQWLFVVEAIPAILLGFVCLRFLPDGPEQAAWLSNEERQLLATALARDGVPAEVEGHGPIFKALLNPRMWQMALFGTGVSAGSYGIIFFLPQIISEFGTTHIQTGLLTTLPFLVAIPAMLAWSWHADRTGERRWHAVAPLAIAAIAFLIAAFAISPLAKMTAIIFAATGCYMAVTLLWGFVPEFFRQGREAAAAVALINMIGILAGFVQPTVMGQIKQITGSYQGGLIFTATVALIGALAGLTLVSNGNEVASGSTNRP